MLLQLKKQAEIRAAQQEALEAKERAEAERKAKRQAELSEVCVFREGFVAEGVSIVFRHRYRAQQGLQTPAAATVCASIMWHRVGPGFKVSPKHCVCLHCTAHAAQLL